MGGEPSGCGLGVVGGDDTAVPSLSSMRRVPRAWDDPLVSSEQEMHLSRPLFLRIPGPLAAASVA